MAMILSLPPKADAAQTVALWAFRFRSKHHRLSIEKVATTCAPAGVTTGENVDGMPFPWFSAGHNGKAAGCWVWWFAGERAFNERTQLFKFLRWLWFELQLKTEPLALHQMAKVMF